MDFKVLHQILEIFKVLQNNFLPTSFSSTAMKLCRLEKELYANCMSKTQWLNLSLHCEVIEFHIVFPIDHVVHMKCDKLSEKV